MSAAGDALREMSFSPRTPRALRARRPRPLSEADVAALLRGDTHADRPDLAGLAAFTREVHALTEQSPAPSPALAALLSQGFDPTAVTAQPAVPASTTSSPTPIRGLLVRLAGASLLVKLSAGTGVAVAATAAAAGTGVLPEAVQDRVTRLVEAVTPGDSPDLPPVPVPASSTPPATPRSTPAEPPAVVPAPRPSAVPSAEAGERVASPRPTDRAATPPPEQAPSRPADSERATSVRP